MLMRTLVKRGTGRVTLQLSRHYSAPGEAAIPASKQKYVPTSGTYPKGFLAGSAHVGVKASNTRFDDLALIVSETPCTASAVFTKNVFQAAPVQVSSSILNRRKRSGIRAVIVNSGCANAVTGKDGLTDAQAMAMATDTALSEYELPDDEFGVRSLVMSTGVIGQRLPIDKILNKIPDAVSALGSTHDHWLRTARAICTTDTFPKLISREFTLPSQPGKTYRMAGMTKGAGMIHPNMATLLGIVCTDAAIDSQALHLALRLAVDKSFNCISIDGDTSTNDTVALLSNGAACEPDTAPITLIPSRVNTNPANPNAMRDLLNDADNADLAAFVSALTSLTTSLAHLVVRDGEGATKFVTIRVAGARSRRAGHRIASTIARSPLVKTALYGRDANWGRILCAIGYTRLARKEKVFPDKVSVSFVRASAGNNTSVASETSTSEESNELKLLINGEPQVVDEARAAEMLAEEDLEILVRLWPEGEAKAFSNAKVLQAKSDDLPEFNDDILFWTCDFSHEYVTINGDYRT